MAITDKSAVAVSTRARNEKGLRAWQATLFIIGDVAGTGVLALPNAILGIGWIGFFVMAAFGAMTAYAGVRLAACWNILEERYEEYRSYEVRDPYQVIATRTFGVSIKRLVSATIFVNLFGACVVLILLAAEMLQGLFHSLSICNWAIIVAAALIPLTWLGTPKDFWMIAFTATVSVFVATLLLFSQMLLDIEKIRADPMVDTYPAANFNGISLAFGTFLFAFNGAGAFLNVQNDMMDRSKFPASVVFGYLGVGIAYAPIAISGYFVYGGRAASAASITEIISDGTPKRIAEALLLLHLMCAFVTLINPIHQEIEGHLAIPTGFNLKSCCLRTFGVLCALFVGETIPHFGKILSFIGGSACALLGFVFPCLFYMKLINTKSPSWKEIKIPLYDYIFMWTVIVVGVCAGIAATYSSVWDIADPQTFTKPCYLRS